MQSRWCYSVLYIEKKSITIADQPRNGDTNSNALENQAF
jgi:hypothetical protein